MTIKEVEEQTGLSRSNIRFYEKKKLIQPARDEKNGYRDYTNENVCDIKKIAYLRTLGISVEDIYKVIHHEALLSEVIKSQKQLLEGQMSEVYKALKLCSKMAAEGNVEFDTLQIENYVSELPAYWKQHKRVFRVDALGFLHVWSSLPVWGIITLACLLTAALVYNRLPLKIPVQFSGGKASATANKIYIFVFPLFCVAARCICRPVFRWRFRLWMPFAYPLAADYGANVLCFTALTVEIFSILFAFGHVKNIVMLLAADVVVFGGMLLLGGISVCGWPRTFFHGEE